MGGTTTTETDQDFLSTEQRRNINAGLNDIYGAYQSGAGDFHGIAPDPLSAGTNAAAGGLSSYGAPGGYGFGNMSMGQNYARDALGQDRPDLAGGVAGANEAIAGLTPGMQQLLATARGDFLDPYSNPAFTAGRDNMRTEFQEGTLPGIDSTFTSAGRSGSGLKALQQGRAMEGLARAENTLAGQVYQQERAKQEAAARALQQGGFQGMGQLGDYYGRVAGDMRGAAGMLPGFNRMGLDSLYGGLAGGRVFDDFNERMRQYGIDQFGATNPWARAQRIMALSQGQYNQSGTTRESYNPGAMDMIGMGVGAGLGTAGLFMGA